MSHPLEDRFLDRRRALQLLGVGLTALGLEACKGGSTAEAPSGGSAPAAAAPPPPAPPPPQAAPPPSEPTPPAAQQEPPAPAQAAPPAEVKPAPAPEAAAPDKPAGLTCKTAAPIDETSKGMRRALQYQEAGTTPEKRCKLCLQFEAGKYGECGGCKLFTGAVNPEGVCLSFAPRQLKKG